MDIAPVVETQTNHQVLLSPNLNEKSFAKKTLRISVKGKFFFLGAGKFYIKGVTYGAFEPDSEGREFHDKAQINDDFHGMSLNGFNTVRIYTMPPRYLLDIAERHNLKVMVSLTAEQYVGFLFEKKEVPDITGIIKAKLKNCIGHPALLCIAVGNEIPADIVRWIGRKKIERYIKKIFDIIKSVDPKAIVTYVNYPTTEYLQLPFLDLLCFNVYLEEKSTLESYLARLQNIANDRPLVLSEVGLDCIRNGEEKQAEMLEWQIRSTFKAGSAGVFLYAWTDEWFRGGEEVHDWAFGLTRKDRTPKKSLAVVSKVLAQIPFNVSTNKPLVSVVVCTHNGQRTIRECLEGLLQLEYENVEILVINDGSTDNTINIINEFPFRVISTEPVGLSRARNIGMQEAAGEIVAYLDDDAYPDPHWVSYLAEAFKDSDYAAIGGPNVLPGSCNIISDCVDHTPGAPTHVLLSDIEAEHIPGCNMAFRKKNLESIGGFDVQFRTAGDDVDLCWRIQDAGWKIGFCSAALVWHHRRNTVKGFWKQQLGYGKAEALLERKWSEKYNGLGHRTWGGMIYSNGNLPSFMSGNWKIYYGIWGSAPFQSIYDAGNRNIMSLVLMPEWYILSAGFFILSMMGIFLKPLLFLAPLTVFVIILPVSHIIHRVSLLEPNDTYNRSLKYKIKFQIITIFLHMIQPLARLIGRLQYDLTPWRRFSKRRLGPFYSKNISVWCNNWIEPVIRRQQLEHDLRQSLPHIKRGGVFDNWDLWVKGGVFGGVKIQMAAEDHAQRKQYLRFKLIPHWPLMSRYILFSMILFITISVYQKEWYAVGILSTLCLLFFLRVFSDFAIASGWSLEAMKKQADIKK
jgi:GT2 family glycosyltransferase